MFSCTSQTLCIAKPLFLNHWVQPAGCSFLFTVQICKWYQYDSWQKVTTEICQKMTNCLYCLSNSAKPKDVKFTIIENYSNQQKSNQRIFG